MSDPDDQRHWGWREPTRWEQLVKFLFLLGILVALALATGAIKENYGLTRDGQWRAAAILAFAIAA